MRFAASSTPFKSFLIGALLLTPAATARAGDDAIDEVLPRHFERQVLMSVENPYGAPETFLDHFHFTKKRGVEFRQVLSLDDLEFAFTLYGPVVKKKPGLGFRLTGKIGKHNVQVKGYGNVKRQGITVRVDF